MLAIRFSRFGKKKYPIYRIIVNEKNKDVWGDYKERLGHYNPHTKELVIDAEKTKTYISQGAQPSKSVFNLLIEKGIIEGKKKGVTHINKKRAKKIADTQAAEEEAKKAAEEAAKAEQEAPAEEAPAEAAPTEEVAAE
jgi:small subunit ribosomal protein S16